MPQLTVNYAHAWEEMSKGIDNQGPYYRVKYYFTDWSQSDTVANELRGYTARSGSTTIRSLPHTHPLSPNLICTDVEIEGCGNAILNANGFPSYDAGFFAIATYRTWFAGPMPANDPNGNNQIDPTNPILWATQELDFEDETYVLDETNYYQWESDNKASKIPVKVTLNVITMVIIFYQLPYLPLATISSLNNCVNTSTVLGVGIGKLWFKGAKTTRELNTDGTIAQRVQMVFKARSVEWNKYLRKDGTWDYLKNSGGDRVLPTGDLTPLLQV